MSPSPWLLALLYIAFLHETHNVMNVSHCKGTISLVCLPHSQKRHQPCHEFHCENITRLRSALRADKLCGTSEAEGGRGNLIFYSFTVDLVGCSWCCIELRVGAHSLGLIMPFDNCMWGKSLCFSLPTRSVCDSTAVRSRPFWDCCPGVQHMDQTPSARASGEGHDMGQGQGASFMHWHSCWFARTWMLWILFLGFAHSSLCAACLWP